MVTEQRETTHMPIRRRLPIVLALAMLMTVLVSPNRAEATPLCDGKPATQPGKLTGDSGNDVIIGTAGNDIIKGFKGNDIICGMGGNDTIYAGEGHDKVFGGNGNDTIEGHHGSDQIFGQKGNDTLRGGTGKDVIHGNDGDDKIYAGSHNDTVYGGNGKDTVAGETGDDVLSGGPGVDHVYGNSGEDELHGGPGNDVVSGGADDDEVRGGVGNDTVYGYGGNDDLYGGDGNDNLLGGDGNDNLDGGAGTDTANGNTGTDTCEAETQTNCIVAPVWHPDTRLDLDRLGQFNFTVSWCCVLGDAPQRFDVYLVGSSGYRHYQGETSGHEWTFGQPDFALEPGTLYGVEVVAVNAAGYSEPLSRSVELLKPTSAVESETAQLSVWASVDSGESCNVFEVKRKFGIEVPIVPGLEYVPILGERLPKVPVHLVDHFTRTHACHNGTSVTTNNPTPWKCNLRYNLDAIGHDEATVTLTGSTGASETMNAFNCRAWAETLLKSDLEAKVPALAGLSIGVEKGFHFEISHTVSHHVAWRDGEVGAIWDETMS